VSHSFPNNAIADFAPLGGERPTYSHSLLFCASSKHSIWCSGFPTMIFLHKGHVYTYKGKRDYDSIKAFVTGGFDDNNTPDNIYKKRPIPPPPTLLGEAFQVAKAVWAELKDAAMGKSGPAGYAMIGLMAIIFVIMIMFIGFLAMFFIPARKGTSPVANGKKIA
jgi:hypothetical protein